MTLELIDPRQYHLRTKHHFRRYAAGPGQLDWNSQPDPFRVFTGCPRTPLPLHTHDEKTTYATFYGDVSSIASTPISIESIATLFEFSVGLSAWKQHGTNRWALRCNPSSGNLHPTEAYLITNGCPGVPAGVHHYVSRDHVLELRCHFQRDHFVLAENSLLIGLSSVHWREAWKYGERAYRYCQHDVGHAIAAVRYSAALLGWGAQTMPTWSDDDIGNALGLFQNDAFGSAEHEHPDVLIHVYVNNTEAPEEHPDKQSILDAVDGGKWHGKANVLSSSHLHDWPVIDAVALACKKTSTAKQADSVRHDAFPPPLALESQALARDVIVKRRSAQAFDGITSMTSQSFFRMLDVTLPRIGSVPWDSISNLNRLDLALFVHRVDGLAPGLYALIRNRTREQTLRSALRPNFEWSGVNGCPAHIPLYRLIEGNARDAARTLSCHQDIASDGAFSLGMLAEFDAALEVGDERYRELFWEAGVLGHVLYLEAQAIGLQGTGIGCYFDDAVHEVLGISDTSFQSMYHFTVGGAVEDQRLQTIAAYAHLASERITQRE